MYLSKPVGILRLNPPLIHAQMRPEYIEIWVSNIVFPLHFSSLCYTILQEFIVEIRYFTVSLPLFSSTMMTDVVLSLSNKFQLS